MVKVTQQSSAITPQREIMRLFRVEEPYQSGEDKVIAKKHSQYKKLF